MNDPATRRRSPSGPERLESEALHATALSLVVQVRGLQRDAISPGTPSTFTAPRVLAEADALHEHVVRYVADPPTSPDGTVMPEVSAILDAVREALVLVDDLVQDARTVSAPAAPGSAWSSPAGRSPSPGR